MTIESMSCPPSSFVKVSAGRGKVIAAFALLVVGSLITVCLLVEGVLAVFLPPPITWLDPQESYNFDPLLGHRLVPNQNSFTHSFSVSTNSHGFRDREVSLQPSPGIKRVLCLGDSLTFGDGVAVGDTYPKQLEVLLNSVGARRYEVINAGVPSYDTWQEGTFFKTRGIEFKPEIVVLGFYSNDVVPRPPAVQTLLTGGGTLRRQGLDGFVPDVVVHLLKRSRLVLFLKDRLGKLGSALHPSSEFLHQQSLLEGIPNDFVEQGWQEVEASLMVMAELQKPHKFKFLIVMFPMAEQLMREHPNAQYQVRLKAIAEKYHIPIIDLQPSFSREFRGFESLFIEWDGHPNPQAHRLAAEELARVLGPMIQSE